MAALFLLQKMGDHGKFWLHDIFFMKTEYPIIGR